MKRFFFVTLYLFTFGFISNIQSQTIRGQLICKSLEKVDSLPGILVAYDSISTISDIKGRFIFDKIKKYPESIQISGILCPKLLITNLTKGYKLLDLGQIELIEHLIISTSQYDSLRNSLVSSFKSNDLLITLQQKADSKLKSRYKPIRDWNGVIGYYDSFTLSKDEMIHPFDKNVKIKVRFNVDKDLITLDYNELKQ